MALRPLAMASGGGAVASGGGAAASGDGAAASGGDERAVRELRAKYGLRPYENAPTFMHLAMQTNHEPTEAEWAAADKVVAAMKAESKNSE